MTARDSNPRSFVDVRISHTGYGQGRASPTGRRTQTMHGWRLRHGKTMTRTVIHLEEDRCEDYQSLKQ